MENQSFLVDIKCSATGAAALRSPQTRFKTPIYREIQRDSSGGDRLLRELVWQGLVCNRHSIMYIKLSHCRFKTADYIMVEIL